MQSSQTAFMQRAIELAQKHSMQGTGGPFGAVIVLDNQIVAEGWNEVTSSLDPTAHAEITAIRKACKKIKNFRLENALIFSTCEPCPMCLSAIYWARISGIYFAASRKEAKAVGFDDDFLYNELPLALEKRTIPCQQMLKEDAFRMMQLWQNKPDKMLY